MDRYGGDYDVILVDWHNLAWFLQVETYQSSFVNISSCYVILVQDKYHVIFFDVFWQGLLYLDIHCIRFVSSSILTLQISSWDDYIYDLAARNSIDVGEFVGRCLAGVIQQ